MTNPGTRILNDVTLLANADRVVTIGNFDGIHRGHQYLIQQVVRDASKRGSRSTVITFEPHPTTVLRPDVPFHRLTTPAEKLRLLSMLGADEVLVLSFTPDFSAQTPEQFLKYLTLHSRPVAMFVGEGFRFGRDRAGDGESIRAFGAEHGFDTTIISRLRENGGVISSSSIRGALSRGDIQKANDWLGRRYRLRGIVEHGAARGRDLGFPTANLHLEPLACLPADGIYAAYAHVVEREDGPRPAMVYVGTRPTFAGGERVVEANILDFSGDLYARELEVEFVQFIRADAQFASAEELSLHMRRDEESTRAVLATVSSSGRKL